MRNNWLQGLFSPTVEEIEIPCCDLLLFKKSIRKALQRSADEEGFMPRNVNLIKLKYVYNPC